MSKSKKRVISFILVVVVMLSLSVAVWARYVENGTWFMGAGKASSALNVGHLGDGQAANFLIYNQTLDITAQYQTSSDHSSTWYDIGIGTSVIGEVDGLKFRAFNGNAGPGSCDYQLIVI